MEQTAIEWTDNTFNPWWGCTKVSPGCDNCYAAALDRRTGGNHWGPAADYRQLSAANWSKPAKWNRQAAKAGTRTRVFCASMADVFDNHAPQGERERLWQVIRDTPALEWQLLTKRPGNIAAMLPTDWNSGYPNVWLGTTIENADVAEQRHRQLVAVPAAVRFISFEPLIGDVSPMLPGILDGIDWTIIGGESGNGHRPINPEWVSAIIENCRDTGTAVFFKQWGGFRPKSHGCGLPGGGEVKEFPR